MALEQSQTAAPGFKDSREIVVVFQGRFPAPDGPAAGVRRVSDFANGLALNGKKVSMWVPAHFTEHKGLQNLHFTVKRLGAEQDSPTATSRIKFWSSVFSRAILERPAAIIFYNTTIDSYVWVQKIRRNGIFVAYELCDRFSTTVRSIPKRFLHLLSEYYLPRASNLNVVITNAIAQWVRRCSPKTPVTIVPGLVDPSFFEDHSDGAASIRSKLRIEQNEFLVAYSGSWCKHKGLSYLLRAFQRFQNNVSHQTSTRLLITGNPKIDASKDDARRIAKDLGIEQNVCFPGNLSQADLFAVLAASNAVVSPSTNDAFSHNAFPTKLAEYAAMGKAIVATSVGDAPLYFQSCHNALLCKPNDEEDMATKIGMIFDSPELADALGVEARRTASEHFDVVHAMNRLLQTIEAAKLRS